MFHYGGRVVAPDVRESVCSAVGPDQEAVALRIITCGNRSLVHTYQSAVTVLAVSCRDALADDPALGASSDVDHLGARVRLLAVVRDCHRIELRRGIISLEDGGWIFPGYSGAGLHLGPAQVRSAALAYPSLGHEVEDAATSLGVARVPVLDSGILHVGVLFHHYLDYSRVQLVLVTHRRRAAFHIAQGGALVGHDQGPFELSGAGSVDPEVAGKVHRALHTFRDIAEAAVAEYR